MNISVISFTLKGAKVGRRLIEVLKAEQENDIDGYHLSKFQEEGLCKIETSLGEWTKAQFKRCDALVFIGATGIAVRAIAPYLESKAKDPAVLVVDECGQYVIPLVSGHIGGANKLARTVSKILGAQAIVTTATDLEGCFAVDEWAKENELYITDYKLARDISAALLHGKKVGLECDGVLEGILPEGIWKGLGQEEQESKPLLGMWVGWQKQQPFVKTLWLIPPVVTVGIGCRKGVSKAQIDMLISQELARLEIPLEAVKCIGTIDLKKAEEGLLAWTKEKSKLFVSYSVSTLMSVEGHFTASAFVKQVTGVDNVCERAAVQASHGGELISFKTALEGVTCALAVEGYKISFVNKGCSLGSQSRH